MVASMFPTRVTTRQVYALGALAAVLFGYDNGIIGAALLFIPHDLPLTPWQKGAVVSATVFGAMLGALGSGPAADRQGRQRILLAAGVVFTIGALGAGAAATVNMLVAFRFILGLGIGIASVMVPLYLAEMAPARDRGMVTSLNQYMIIVGTASGRRPRLRAGLRRFVAMDVAHRSVPRSRADGRDARHARHPTFADPAWTA